MKLNLGCNHHPLNGYINIDVCPYQEANLVADVTRLPFPGGSVSEIYAGHLLEHIAHPVDFFLECWRVLEPGGELVVVIPDIARFEPGVDVGVGTIFGFWLSVVEPQSTPRASLHRSLWNFELLVTVAHICGFDYLCEVDRWNDSRLVAGAEWQSGAVLRKANLDPEIPFANRLFHAIDRGDV